MAVVLVDIEKFIRSVDARLFGVDSIEKVTVQNLAMGLHNHNFIIDIIPTLGENKKFVLRMPATQEHIVNKIPEFEFAKLKELEGEKIAPKPIALIQDSYLGKYVVVMEYVSGVHKDFNTLTTDEIGMLATAVAKLHKLKQSRFYSPGYGFPPSQEGNHAAYMRGITERNIVHVFEKVKHIISDEDQKQVYMALGQLYSLVAVNEEYFSGSNFSLLHGDINMGNVLWTEEGVRFVDWEDSYYGDPANEVAYIFTINNMRGDFKSAFLDEYKRHITDETLEKRIPVYAFRDRIFDVVWAAGKLAEVESGTEERQSEDFYKEAYRVRMNSLKNDIIL